MENTMREPLAMLYFMLPVLVPAVIVLWWASLVWIYDQLERVQLS